MKKNDTKKIHDEVCQVVYSDALVTNMFQIVGARWDRLIREELPVPVCDSLSVIFRPFITSYELHP